MLKRKCIVLSDVENGSNKKAVLALEEDGVGISGTLRLYNFSAEPAGVLSLGLHQKSRVFKAGLTRKSQMYYTFFVDLKEIPSVFSCAVVNFQNAQAKPILYGSSSGNNDEIYANIISELSNKTASAATAQSVLDKFGVDFDDEEKMQIEAEIDTAICTNCENCIYKNFYLQHQNLAKNADIQSRDSMENSNIELQNFVGNANNQQQNLSEENNAQLQNLEKDNPQQGLQANNFSPKVFRVENFFGEEKKSNILKNGKNSVKFSNFFEKNSDFMKNSQNLQNSVEENGFFGSSNPEGNYRPSADKNFSDYTSFSQDSVQEDFPSLDSSQKTSTFKDAIQENLSQKNVFEKDSFEGANSFSGQESENLETDFFGRLKPQIDKLFQDNPAEEHLQNIIPSSKWVRVESSEDGDFYVFGLLYDEDGQIRYVCYGVPAVFEENPPKELLGYPIWLPLGQDDGFGYWLMYQDAATGQPVKAVIS